MYLKFRTNNNFNRVLININAFLLNVEFLHLIIGTKLLVRITKTEKADEHFLNLHIACYVIENSIFN